MAEQARNNQRQRPLHVVGGQQPANIAGWDDFERFVLAHPDHHWELIDGVVREKPGMASEHNDMTFYLAHEVANQLDRRVYRVRTNSAHVQRTSSNYLIPDICVLSDDSFRTKLGYPDRLELYEEPLYLVVEIWSRSTGAYDINTKIPEYRARGDLEIWRLHPYERTLTVWRRQADGSYEEAHYTGGSITVSSLPNVSIDLDALFDFA